MGVDLATYRTRIGTFGHSVGVDVVTVVCYVNFAGGLKKVGSVIFIGILLLIAGIESNPGPKTEGAETQILQCKLKVADLPDDVDEEMLKTFFEQTDEMGGGKVISVTLDRNRNQAIIEFESSEAVETVLLKQPIIIHKKQVAVKMPEFDPEEYDKYEVINEWMHKLDLNRYAKRKLTVADILAIDPSSLQEDVCHKLKELPLLFLKQLLSANSECMDLRLYNLEQPGDNSESRGLSAVDALFHDTNNEEMISPLDLLLMTFQSCDLELRQLLCQKLYLCKLAVPFLFHDIYLEKDFLSIWPLHSVIIENKISQEMADPVLYETEALQMSTKTVAFARFGRPTCSKSKFLNGVMCSFNSHTFFNKDCQSGLNKRYCTEGYVEMFWLPTIGEITSRFKDPVTFFNVRGDILNQFLVKNTTLVLALSDVFILFLDIKSILFFQSEIHSILMQHNNSILVIGSPLDSKNQKIMKALKTIESSVKSRKQTFHLLCTYSRGKERQQVDVCTEISKKICEVLISVKPESSTLCGRLKASTQYQELTDENDECMSARGAAESVLKMMKNISSQEHWTKKVTPVQYIHSRTLGKLLKDMCSKKEQHEYLEVKQKIEETRKKQMCVTNPVKIFIRHFIDFSDIPDKLHFFLTWLRIFLEEEKGRTAVKMDRKHQDLWNEYNGLKRDENPNPQEIKKYEELIRESEIKIEEASFGLANFFREISHIYDALLHLSCHPSTLGLPDMGVTSRAFANFILAGHTFELLDGNSLFMALKWNKEILGYVHKGIDRKKVLAFSVLGLQSSGKSTLLNTMFGVQFIASSGRCTRGIHAQLIPVKQAQTEVSGRFNYILVIDTEGLRAPELKDTNYKRDNELATIITGLGDITMLNVMGENTSEIRDVLQIIVHAFLRLNLANPKVDIRKNCVFIHQNVSDMSASEKMKAGLQLSVENLDKVTKESAESEGIANINTFDQVIAFKPETDVWYLPNLWKGNPPMAQVNRKYSEKVVDISQKLVQRSLDDKNKSFKSLEDIIDYTNDLWQGVLAENFLFSFRNSLEKKAYIALESKLKNEFWRIETSIDEILYKLCREKFSKCESNADLQEEKQSVCMEIQNFAAENSAAMSERLEHFFETNEYKDTTIQWKEQTLNQARMFTTGIVDKKKPEIERLYQKRACDIFAQSINAKNEDELRTKSAEVAKRLRRQNPSVEQIDAEFENIWKVFIKDSLPSVNTQSQSITLRKLFIQRLYIMFGHDHAILSKVLNQQSLLEKRLNIKYLSGSFHLTTISAEDLSLKWRLFKLVSKLLTDKADTALEAARDNLEEVFRITDEMIEKYKQKDEEITDSDIGYFLHSIYQEICKTFVAEALEFTAKRPFYVKTMVHISNFACCRFEEHNCAYQLEHGVKAKLQKYKVQCRDRFYAHLEDRENEETAAMLFQHEAVRYINETVLDSLPAKSKPLLRQSLPSCKYAMIIDILTDLAHKNEFCEFLRYIKHPHSFANSWVTNKVLDALFCSTPSLYRTIAESDMHLYINDLKKVINMSDVAFKKKPSIDEWITHLCGELEFCKFPPETFKDVRKEFGTTCQVNVENFKSSLLEHLMQAENDLKRGFFAVTAATVRWRVFNPCDEFLNELWGCEDECKFCGEPCKHGTKNHAADHECLQHRPGGLIGISKVVTNKVVVETCDFRVASGTQGLCEIFDYKCNKSEQPCSLGSHSYSDYKKFFPDWDIKPGTDMLEKSKFWFWFMGKYKNELKDLYKYEISNIPAEWSTISKEEAVRSLRQVYL